MTQFALQPNSPLDGLNIEENNQTNPVFADIDGDELVDLILGVADGSIKFYKNTGTKTTPVFEEKIDAENPFNGISVEEDRGGGDFGVSHPALTDIDLDGDLDLFVGNAFGEIFLYENTGTQTNPQFSATETRSTKTGNLFTITNVTEYAAPTFVDIDGDGKQDLFIGRYSEIVYYKNESPDTINSLDDIKFTQKTGNENPLSGVTSSLSDPVKNRLVPAFLDFRGTGSYDAFVGRGDNQILHFKNQGSETEPHFVEQVGENNFFNDYNQNQANASNRDLASPTFVDVDGDEVAEAFIGFQKAEIGYFEQTSSTSDPIPEPKPAKQYELVEENQGPLIVTDEDLVAPVLVKFNDDNKLDILIGTDDEKLIYFEQKDDGTFAEPETNPFANLDLTETEGSLKPALVDIDSDGDLDLFIGDDGGKIKFFRNTRNVADPNSQDSFTEENELFGLESVEKGAAPTFIVDDTGKVKWAFIGSESNQSGLENYLKVFWFDEGKSKFIEVGKNEEIYPFKDAQLQIADKQTKIVPAFGDYDRDGDIDAIIGQTDVEGKEGQLLYFENVGTASELKFVQRTDEGNPFKDVNSMGGKFDRISPTVGDFTGDGELEIFAGTQSEDGMNGIKYLTLPEMQPDPMPDPMEDPKGDPKGDPQSQTDSNFNRLTLERGSIFKMGSANIGSRVIFQLKSINISRVSEITISFLDASDNISFSEVLFSTLPPEFQPRGFAFGRQKLFLKVDPNQRFKVNIQTVDRSIISQEANILEIEPGQFELKFPGGITIELEQSLENPPIGVGDRQKSGFEILDLESVSGVQNATFTVTREANYTNEVYFYRIDDENGTIDGLAPGQTGYAEAAIRNRVNNPGLQVSNEGTNVQNGSFDGGFLYAPVIVVNGTVNDFLNLNPNNFVGSEVQAYFVFGEANSDRADHIRLLGNNTFGFEDLPNGGDNDFNDIVIETIFA